MRIQMILTTDKHNDMILLMIVEISTNILCSLNFVVNYLCIK